MFRVSWVAIHRLLLCAIGLVTLAASIGCKPSKNSCAGKMGVALQVCQDANGIGGAGGDDDTASGGTTKGGTTGMGGTKTGGAGGKGTAATGGGGAGPTTLPEPIWTESFEGDSDSGDWVVDNSSASDGMLSARPRDLDDLGKGSLTTSCGDGAHSLLRFSYRGVRPAAGQELRFSVDGVLYDIYGQTPDSGWAEVTIAVPLGAHEYTWEATTDTAGRPPFWLDDLRCVAVPNEPNESGRFDFDDGFVPTEIASSWQINNTAAQSKSPLLGLGARAPYLDDLESAKIDFSCGGKDHSQLTFWYRGVRPAAGQELRFSVDGVLYDIYGQTPDSGWVETTIVVPSGTHDYSWEATTDTAGRPPFWLDSIRCIDMTIEDNTNGRFDLDDGFVPPELTSEWQINNTAAQSKNADRALGARAPYLDDLESAKIDFSCGGKDHSQLTFWYRGVRPAAGQELRFSVDGVLYDIYGQTPDSGWVETTIVVPSGTHDYSWEATTDTAGRPPFWLDSIRCIDTAIEANTNGRFDLDDGFVPPELTSEWQINNTAAQSKNGDRALGARAPYLEDTESATIDFSCGDVAHSQLTFWYRGVRPAAGQALRFYVDDELHETYGQTPDSGWAQATVNHGASEMHSYRWEATTDTAGRPPFWLDSIRCQ